MYRNFIRPILFLFTPETIHNFIISLFKLFNKNVFIYNIIRRFTSSKRNSKLGIELFNLKFEHRVGLAAGLDKDAEAFNVFGALGFSFVEVGTVTPLSQPGNPKPRVFRLPKDKSLINRMGFNNKGVDNMVINLKKKFGKTIIGGNIGKNKLTDNKLAIKDYLLSLNKLAKHVDYIAINISSPNTPGLRDLQHKEELNDLLSALNKERNSILPELPLLVKIAPDLSNDQIVDVLESIEENNINGIIATNTTIERANLFEYDKEFVASLGNGGLSGKALTKRATEIVSFIYKQTNGQLPIIAVGGIMTAQDALDKLNAGASLVQLYTGFIYEGPALIRNINKLLLKNHF